MGAVYEWDGNRDVGAGRLEITEVVAARKVVMDLHFLKPMEGRNIAEYRLTPLDAGQTEVVWAIYGSQPFLQKIMSVFINCDKMICTEFEKGLADLKARAEKR